MSLLSLEISSIVHAILAEKWIKKLKENMNPALVLDVLWKKKVFIKLLVHPKNYNSVWNDIYSFM